MNLLQVTETLNMLSAADGPRYQLHKANDDGALYQAFQASGEKIMISDVDRKSAPFSAKLHNPHDTSNHVITISDMSPAASSDGAQYRIALQMNTGAATDLTVTDRQHLSNADVRDGGRPTVFYITEAN